MEEQVRRWTSTLLWEACRRDPDPRVVRQTLSMGADPRSTVDEAIRHGIAPLLWRALCSAEACDALGHSADDLKALADLHKMQAKLILPRVLRAAIGPLNDAGLEPVVLKGPAVSARYPEQGLRPMEDIDLLLPRSQHAGALRCLEASGWRVVRPSRRDRYDTVLSHRDTPAVALELHYGLDSRFERVSTLDAEALWAKRVPIECWGTPAFGLPVPEEIVFLSVHAGKPFHGFSRIVWIADLAMIVGALAAVERTVDWERVRSLAESANCLTLVSTAIALARHAGVSAPGQLFVLPGDGWRSAALGRMTEPEWPLDVSESSNFHTRFALTDGFWRRTRLLVGSGHGMHSASRAIWTATAPFEAISRLRELRRSRSRSSHRAGGQVGVAVSSGDP